MLYFGMAQVCNLILSRRCLSTTNVRPYNQVNIMKNNVRGQINHMYHFDVWGFEAKEAKPSRR